MCTVRFPKVDDAEWVTPTRTVPKPELHWIELEVLDTEGVPLAGERFLLTDPAGKEHSGNLNRQGFVRIEPILAGNCKVRFPGVDECEWAMATLPGRPGETPKALARTHWIALEVVDVDGVPLAGEEFTLTDAAGELHSGRLDRKGGARLEALPLGTCSVRFPGLNKSDFIL
jgi:hypothetical protein